LGSVASSARAARRRRRSAPALENVAQPPEHPLGRRQDYDYDRQAEDRKQVEQALFGPDRNDVFLGHELDEIRDRLEKPPAARMRRPHPVLQAGEDLSVEPFAESGID